jgi:glycosyltransferase involved in cell wall biosynthesis
MPAPRPRTPGRDDQSLRIAMIGTRGLPSSYGGVEVAVEALSRELVRRGHQVSVYGRSAYCDPRVRELDGIEQIPLPQINTKHLEAISHTVLATLHAMSRRRFDVIHFHATGPAMLSVVTRACKVPTVATIHGLDWRREKWGAVARGSLRIAARVAATVPDRTIAVSGELAQSLTSQYESSANYIPNGVHLDGLDEQLAIDGLEPGRFILQLGRIVPEKQAHLLIRAFKEVNSDYRLAIVGPSSNSDSYLREVEELAQQDDRVCMLGPRYGAEKAWLLHNAAVYVQPSTLEGLPITLLEALALDQLTLVSDIPENMEAVTFADGPYGLVFRTGDVDDLTRKLTLALSRSSRLPADTPGISRLVRERYDWERVAGETEAIYFQALAAHGRQPTVHGRQPAAHGRQPTVHGRQPTAHGRQPTAHGRQPTAHDRQPTLSPRHRGIQANAARSTVGETMAQPRNGAGVLSAAIQRDAADASSSAHTGPARPHPAPGTRT